MPAKNATIQDYGLIGDCRSAALVSREGSIDWLCWPKFDSPAIFCAILDRDRGGYWRIGAANAASTTREYVTDTNVLRTTFHCATGVVTLTDLMPVSSEEFKKTTRLPDHEIVRQIECSAGEGEIEVEFAPRAFYGLEPVAIHDLGKLGIRMKVGKGVYWLRTNAPLDLREAVAHSRFHIRAGDIFQFSFSYTEEAPAVLNPLGDFVRDGIKRSITFWREWAGQATYEGPYREAVVRSVLALKLLTFAPSGAIIAAPTTSLPERIGGPLNWDYRYCWLRDASLTIRALLDLGYWDEASDFMEWMLHATWLTQPSLRILYTLYGRPAPKERVLQHLSGYRDTSPVRIGNEARKQLQLDVYGEVVDAAAQYVFHGGTLDGGMQKTLKDFGEYVVKHWQLPDEGIWEPRNGRACHTHSQLLCWTALDRLLALGERGWDLGDSAMAFRETRGEIQQKIHTRAWNPELKSYASTLGGSDMDASLLLLSWYGFEKPDGERMQDTYARVRQELAVDDGLLYRYRCDKSEGAFAMCSFWEAEFLALGGGTFKAATDLFERLLSFRNDLGLYAEEIDPDTGAALGNFPQAFTHVGVISAALSLAHREEGTQALPHRPEKASPHGAVQEAKA
ncbi:MAG TPA: glycoside hydrolase family 15 protein [Terriglobales bacterium]|jgi:GH15 family glucan-1,4-alpha-glucosidase